MKTGGKNSTPTMVCVSPEYRGQEVSPQLMLRHQNIGGGCTFTEGTGMEDARLQDLQD